MQVNRETCSLLLLVELGISFSASPTGSVVASWHARAGHRGCMLRNDFPLHRTALRRHEILTDGSERCRFFGCQPELVEGFRSFLYAGTCVHIALPASVGCFRLRFETFQYWSAISAMCAILQNCPAGQRSFQARRSSQPINLPFALEQQRREFRQTTAPHQEAVATRRLHPGVNNAL